MAIPGNRVNPKVETIPLNLSDVEMVFGSPGKKKEDDVHLIVNERRHNELTPVSNGSHKLEETQPNQPLLEPDRGKQKPPLAGPEIDDLDDEQQIDNNKPYPGIDDGLLEPEDKPHSHKDPHDTEGDVETELQPPTHGDGDGTDEGKWWLSGNDQPDYPYDVNGIGTRFGIDDRPGSPLPGVIPDVNTYQQKKNLAQGFLDLALFTANANQLRYVIETSNAHPYYYFSLVSISISLILQIAVGVGLIMNSRYNVKDDKDICKADKINNMTVLGIFLITIVNVFIAAFSVAPNSAGIPVMAALPAPVQRAE